MGRKLTQQEFVEKATKKHNGKYSYRKSVYTRADAAITITCPIHGDFVQTAANHYLNGHGCSGCGRENTRSARIKGTDKFIEDARAINGDRYDYSFVEYINSKKKVIIICREHGEFGQRPNDHLSGVQCPECAHPSSRKSKEQFVADARKVHGGKYDYSEAIYRGAAKNTVVICPQHGRFKQKPNYHLLGQGCPRCCDSHGERIVSRTLKSLGISYTREKRFPDCKYIHSLPFDFHFELQGVSFLVEYDGRQHYFPYRLTGGEKKLRLIQKRDAIKTKYARDNGHVLIRIPYTEKKKIGRVIRREIEKYISV